MSEYGVRSNEDRKYSQQSTLLPVENVIYPGKIRKIEAFGAFVEIQGFSYQGLVHISHISKDRVENVAEVVVEGQDVFVKVLSIESSTNEGSSQHRDKPRIALSMKFANQSDGTDRDPNGIEAERSVRMKRSFGKEMPAPLTLDAVYKTICGKCGGRGHLAIEWYFCYIYLYCLFIISY